MISTLWNNLRTPQPGVQILINSGDTAAKHIVIDVQTVQNRGDVVGFLIETLTKTAAPGSSKKLSVIYAFSNHDNRSPTELATGATTTQLSLDTGGDGTLRSYVIALANQMGRYLHVWFTADTFTDPTCQIEVDLSVLAKLN